MAITYGFYNSMNGDRKYDAVQLSSIFDGVIRDGVFQSIGGYLATKPGTGMQVIVSPGKAWFDHTWTVNDADLPLDISPSDLTLSRYDAVVLETDATKAVRENSIKVVKGTPASAPKKPTLVNEGDVHQHPLAYILVPGGSTEIQVQNIDIMVGKSECPFVTSILESVSIEALLEKWEGEFRVWFDDLQNQMSGDVATNLQNQINKINQTTATEETKSLYGVPSDGTPDDVFQAINSIGDIKVSTRTDLGDSWLLCNGETFSPEKYPELAKIMDTKAVPWREVSLNSPMGDERAIYAYMYCNGFWFLQVDDPHGNLLYYSENPTGPWKQCEIGSGAYRPYQIVFAGGKYYGCSNTAVYLSYAESPGGPWKTVSTSGLRYKDQASPLFVIGNRLCIFTVDSNYNPYFNYADINSPETWTSVSASKAPGQHASNELTLCPIAINDETAFIGESYAGHGNRHVQSYVVTQSEQTPTSLPYAIVGKSSDGFIRATWGNNIEISDTPEGDAKITFEATCGEYGGQAIELGRFIVISDSRGGLEVIDKKTKKSAGKAQNSAWSNFAISDGSTIVKRSLTNNRVLIATEAELAQGLLPTIDIPGAYAYIRGK